MSDFHPQKTPQTPHNSLKQADFLAFTEAHKSPLDFISSHFYPGAVSRGDLVAAINATVALTNRKGLPMVLSEFNSGLSNSQSCCHDEPSVTTTLYRISSASVQTELADVSRPAPGNGPFVRLC